ncbi:MAG: hypothetical protein OXD34_06980 [bacterium]|nr:hypothetical protein [bacterium]
MSENPGQRAMRLQAINRKALDRIRQSLIDEGKEGYYVLMQDGKNMGVFTTLQDAETAMGLLDPDPEPMPLPVSRN